MKMPRISVLMYHQVGNFSGITAHGATFCRLSRFKSQMWWLKRMGYNVISLDHALQGIRGEVRLPKHSVVLTFDDGYVNFYEHAFPILKKYGFPATVYMVSGLIDKQAEWLEKSGLPLAPLMNKQQLNDIKLAGITIGAHTHSHPRLAELTSEQAFDEIVHSKRELEECLQDEVQHFCYPYGSLNKEVMRLAAEAGFETATSCQRGAWTSEHDLMAIPRKAISFGDDLAGVWWKIHMKHKLKGKLILR
ncbi:polysaccharide deacetylase family protein [Thiomicrorhabdus sp. 6S2-11]|uniref:Polysaccharide deacetylase family protein n=1 Tax=Thiomicrorhabdus marina TaxID=2818442 RepID=A0ABS3Q6S7_9GAMM|nr:polysaccharide deacetylase family protein [Thiomicrorhabdus marina]MBO1927654.1 polysaccharide deacetylase family protein [Thiomicrorhabdus marina]